MSRDALQATSIAALQAGFHRRFLAWFALGVPAFVIVLMIYYLMIAKPLALA